MEIRQQRRPLLLKFFKRYLQEESTARFIHSVSDHYTCGTLERLATQTAPEVRRAAVMALCFLSDYCSNQVVGRSLSDDDRGVRLIAENGIRSLWIRAGSQGQRNQLRKVMTEILAYRYEIAVHEATRLIHAAPWYAEAYYQRGNAYLQLGDFELSIRDNHQALEINPYHFPAAIGMGQCYLRTGESLMALDAFRRAIKLNLNLESVRSQVAYLERQLEEM
ncbi:MAG: tetratricopeptide repeat protein [Pirellulaceae bacterium]